MGMACRIRMRSNLTIKVDLLLIAFLEQVA